MCNYVNATPHICFPFLKYLSLDVVVTNVLDDCLPTQALKCTVTNLLVTHISYVLNAPIHVLVQVHSLVKLPPHGSCG